MDTSKHLKEILNNIKHNIPMSFVRMNDGEMMGIMRPGCIVSRGDQLVDKYTSTLLKKAISYRKDNFWIGIPCSVCYNNMRKVADGYVKGHKFVTAATLLTNKHYNEARDGIIDALQDKNIIWVGNRNQNVEALSEIGLNIKVKIDTPIKNAMSELDLIIDEIQDEIEEGDVILLSCGPLSRILGTELFKTNNNVFLDMGSYFDPITQNKSHKYHHNKVPACKECN